MHRAVKKNQLDSYRTAFISFWLLKQHKSRGVLPAGIPAGIEVGLECEPIASLTNVRWCLHEIRKGVCLPKYDTHSSYQYAATTAFLPLPVFMHKSCANHSFAHESPFAFRYHRAHLPIFPMRAGNNSKNDQSPFRAVVAGSSRWCNMKIIAQYINVKRLLICWNKHGTRPGAVAKQRSASLDTVYTRSAPAEAKRDDLARRPRSILQLIKGCSLMGCRAD